MTVLLQKNPIYQEPNRYTHCIEDEITCEKAMARETARNLKNDGIPLATIVKNTGLSLAEVESL